MPDRFGFEHLGGNGGRLRVRCIDCGATGDPWEWPDERRHQHARAHAGIADDVAAEERLDQKRAELARAAVGARRDRHVIHPPRACANPFCGEVFQPRKLTKRFCSDRCRVAVHRARHRGSPET